MGSLGVLAEGVRPRRGEQTDMKWMEDLYVGDCLFKKERDAVKRIRRGRMTVGVYVLILAVNPSNQIDILDANYLLQPYYRRMKDLTIVGIAGGYEDAVLLLARIADECCRRTGTGEIRAYLEERIRGEGDR